MDESELPLIKNFLRAPQDVDVPLWRYMDLTKYAAMLSTGSLYFVRADRLGDPFEGSISRHNFRVRPDVYKGKGIPDHAWNQLSGAFKQARTWAFVNSWHANERESAAMWTKYAPRAGDIAVRSTYRKLAEALPEGVHLGLVSYVDYDAEWMPEGNLLFPLFHKRKEFEHEREVRALIMAFPTNPATQVGSLAGEIGRTVPVDFRRLIDGVVLAPTTEPWVCAVAKAVTGALKGTWSVDASSLDAAPVF